jgi:hypothetical protein
VRTLKSKYKKIFETNLEIMRVTKDNLDKQCHLFRKNLDMIHPPSNQASQNNEEALFSTAKSKSLSEQRQVEGMNSADFNVVSSYIIEEEMSAQRENEIVVRIEEVEKVEAEVIRQEEKID